MNKILLKLNFWIESLIESKPREERSIFTKIWENALKLIDNYLLYFYLTIKQIFGFIRVNPLIDSQDLPIISLTSFPARLCNLWMVIYEMYCQTIKPGKIVVTLINEEIPGGYDSLPNSLKFFSDKGVEFIFGDDNLKPHNKYFYCRQKYPDRILITIDDDLLYYPNTIENLMSLNKEFPSCVCSNRVQPLPIKGNSFAPKKEWQCKVVNREPSHVLLALGYSAVLYPPSFCSEIMYNKTLINKLSLNADDLWLKAVEIFSDVKVVSGDYYSCPVTLPSSQRISLQSINNSEENPRNELYLKKLNDYFKLIERISNSL